MCKVVILYAPDEKFINETANNIATVFNKGKCHTTVKSANQTKIPDITASDIIIFGPNTKEKKTVHPDYKEIIRAFTGINLAGRIAGFFTFGGNESINSFKEILHDTDISLYEPNFLIENNNDPDILMKWVKNIITQYKDGS